jgi:hypothetical protein
VIELDIDGGGLALLPDIFGDGEVEQDHPFGAAAWFDLGLAGERRTGQRLEVGEGDVDIVEVALLNCAAGDYLVVLRGESSAEVADEQRIVQLVVDAYGGEDVEVVLCIFLCADEFGLGLEDGVLGRCG